MAIVCVKVSRVAFENQVWLNGLSQRLTQRCHLHSCTHLWHLRYIYSNAEKYKIEKIQTVYITKEIDYSEIYQSETQKSILYSNI